jgi:hypothetical protein
VAEEDEEFYFPGIQVSRRLSDLCMGDVNVLIRAVFNSALSTSSVILFSGENSYLQYVLFVLKLKWHLSSSPAMANILLT